jgi:signal transduction histidine kinase
MGETYSVRRADGTAQPSVSPLVVSESAAHLAFARELLESILSDVDLDRLLRGLLAEREPLADASPSRARFDSESALAARELQRVRAQFALGAAARSLQHAFSNPLTALLAEAQLLEIERLDEDQKAAVGRILDLARRLVTLSKRLSGSDSSLMIG